jgi:hypothetical protein
MDVAPAPVQERLARAERLANEAAQAGAQLIAFPEVFNTGYAYSPENYALAEPLDGPTFTWMRQTAARLEVHLAGSILLRDQTDIYNALLLVAPDGRFWRYNKNYPWGWERAYFRDDHQTVVAHTDLGDIGMLICWDLGHADLWNQYAGRVDLMLICSSPPLITQPTYHLPDGSTLQAKDMGPVFRSMKDTGSQIFVQMLSEQTAWLGVPTLYTSHCGQFRSTVPNASRSLALMMPTEPRLAKHLSIAHKIELTCGMVSGGKILAADGQAQAEQALEAGESFVLGEIMLADTHPQPKGAQPKERGGLASHLISDVALPAITIPTYRAGVRKAWGVHMAPADSSTRRWLPALGLGAAVLLGLGYLIGKNSRNR